MIVDNQKDGPITRILDSRREKDADRTADLAVIVDQRFCRRSNQRGNATTRRTSAASVGGSSPINRTECRTVSREWTRLYVPDAPTYAHRAA
jgi:hypothetical protein